VPGVGHFEATAALEGEWRTAIGAAVAAGRPLLGICLGMQWLFEGSEEAPDLAGLGIFEGRCTRLLPNDAALKVPHVGWNALEATGRSPLLSGLETGAQMYFTHSYAAPVTRDCVARACHDVAFAAAVARDRVWGVQFHPEKSGAAGLRVLRNFLESCQP
jgi:imidazole glycerol-phosphate synthase subunit HisH